MANLAPRARTSNSVAPPRRARSGHEREKSAIPSSRPVRLWCHVGLVLSRTAITAVPSCVADYHSHRLAADLTCPCTLLYAHCLRLGANWGVSAAGVGAGRIGWTGLRIIAFRLPNAGECHLSCDIR